MFFLTNFLLKKLFGKTFIAKSTLHSKKTSRIVTNLCNFVKFSKENGGVGFQCKPCVFKKQNHHLCQMNKLTKIICHYEIAIIITFLQLSQGTLSVKFGICMCQTTIFYKVLYNCPTYFLSAYYYLFFDKYILKSSYINYNPLFQIITYLIL